MTKTVKGAGRSAAAGRRKKIERSEQRLAELKRDQAKAAEHDQEIERAKAVAGTGGPLKNALHSKVSAFSDAAQEAGWEVTARIDGDSAQHLDCKRGEEVLHIFWLNGVYQKWATHTYGDGKPARVQNAASGLRILAASPSEAKGAATKKAVTARRAAPRAASAPGGAKTESKALTVAEKVDLAMAERSQMVWDEQEMSDDDILEFLQGKRISWVNRLTGSITAARIPGESRHNKVGHGKAGRNISFAAMEGPFMTAALDNIIKVN